MLPPSPPHRLTLNFNPDWKFIQADPSGAAAPGFDDRGWTHVSAPHTFNDADTNLGKLSAEVLDRDGKPVLTLTQSGASAAGAVVAVAHDDRLERPGWLARQFKPTGLRLAIDGPSMKVFQHHADRDEGLTLGAKRFLRRGEFHEPLTSSSSSSPLHVPKTAA